MLPTCYISAAPGIDIAALREVLHQKGLQAVLPADISSTGSTIFEKAKDLIKNADFVLAVLGHKAGNENIYIEIGIAVAYGKRIIIVAPSDFDLQLDVWSLVQVTADFERTEALGFAVDQLLAAPKGKRRRQTKTAKPAGKPRGVKIAAWLRSVESLKAGASNANFEDLVNDILKASGIHVVTRAKDPDAGPDFAIWLPELDTILGNPILIEIKKSLSGRADVTTAVNKITNYMTRSNSRFALLLYLEGPSTDVAQSEARTYQVLLLRLPELIESLKNESFSSHIRRLRNKLVHGQTA